MTENVLKWIRRYSSKLFHSVGFFPAVIALGFFLLAIFSIGLDDRGWGLRANFKFSFLSLEDASTARSIAATITAGIISLMVFSFSMVMVVANQAATQMSNRMLDNVIGDRAQKGILGSYLGTLVFALFILTHISDAGERKHVPAISIYLLLVFTVVDLLLFMYFLHYITHAFRFEQLIKRIHHKTAEKLKELSGKDKTKYVFSPGNFEGETLNAPQSGFFQKFDEGMLLDFCVEHNMQLEFLHARGTYLLQGTPLLKVSGRLDDKEIKRLMGNIDFYYGQMIQENAYYGFFHLSEVAVKALSPGVNDPGTAVLSVHALSDLLASVMAEPLTNGICSDDGVIRIKTDEYSFEDLYDIVMLPVLDYGKEDRLLVQAMWQAIESLLKVAPDNKKPFLEQKLSELRACCNPAFDSAAKA